MDEIIKFIAAGGSVTTGLLIWYVYKIEPRLRSLETNFLLGKQVELLRLSKEAGLHPDLHESAMGLLREVEDKLKQLQPKANVS